MSLNHLVTGGTAPPQNVTVNNLVVEGTLSGAGIDSKVRSYLVNGFVFSITNGAYVQAAPPLPGVPTMVVEVVDDRFVTFCGTMLINPTDGVSTFTVNLELPEGDIAPANQWMYAQVSCGNSGGQLTNCQMSAAVYRNDVLPAALPACRLEMYNTANFGALDQYFLSYRVTYEKA